MAYPKFKPTKEFYLKYRNQKALLGRKVVTVLRHETESRSGSYERGLKFARSEWALLAYQLKGTKYYKPRRWSTDHGKTWHDDIRTAMKSKGKLKLTSTSEEEFAFEGIQKINRDYFGPGYRWYP